MADYNISLGVILEADDLQRIRGQINKIETDPIKIQLDMSSVQNQINNIRTQLQNLGNIKINLTGTGFSTGATSGIKNVVKDADWAYQQLLNIQRRASSLEIRIKSLDTTKNVSEIRELSSQLAKLKGDYDTLRRTFGSQLSPAQFGNLQAEVDETTAKLSAMDAKIRDTKANLAVGIQGNFGAYESQIVSLEGKFGNLSIQSNELRVAIGGLWQELNNMRAAATSGDIEALISANERYRNALKNVESQLRINTEAERQSNNMIALSQAKENLSLRMSNWLKDNSAAAKRFGGEIQNLQLQLSQCNNKTDFNRIVQSFNNITLQAKNAGLATQTFGDQLKAQFAKYSSYFSVAMLFTYAIQGLVDMFKQVRAVDSAMVELKKVTNETDESYNRFLTNAASKSKELGTTIDGLVKSAADFARLGYGFEDAQGLAEVANIYAVVGDEIEGVEEATKSLISTMAAFKEQQNGLSNEDFAMDIVDKFNEIGNNFAISSGGIGEALTRSASSLAAANNTLDESIALITAANTVVQNPEVVGTAFKTKFFNKNCLYVQKCA